MVGQQAFIVPRDNLIVEDGITAIPSASLEKIRTQILKKDSNSSISAYGNPTVQKDAEYELVVTSETGTPFPTKPIFSGVSDGELINLKINGLAQQYVTVVCVDVGTTSEYATIMFEGLEFRYPTKTSDGNLVYILIDESELVFTETDYTVVKNLAVGDTELTGQEWDFDTKSIQGGIIPDDVHRLAFGENQFNIYWQYKDDVDGETTYYFIRPIQNIVLKGSKVYYVTGGRTITITDGTSTSETYHDIKTIADFWQAVRARPSSILVPVDNAINTVKNIDSPAVREITTKTDAHFKPSYGEGSKYALGVVNISVSDGAYTELIEATCIDNTTVGNELWSLKGSTRGELSDIRTGDNVVIDNVQFRIPQKLPEGWDNADRTKRSSKYTGDAEVCIQVKAGKNIEPQRLQLRYRARPEDCDCPTTSFSSSCLGLDTIVEEGGDTVVGFTVIDLVSWSSATWKQMREAFGNMWDNNASRDDAELKFTNITRSVFSEFEELAKKIFDLPDGDSGDDTRLLAMVDDFKDVVNSLTIYAESYTYTWTGSAWTPDAGGYAPGDLIHDAYYSGTLWKALWEEYLDYEKTYTVKKNIIVEGCYTDPGDDYYFEFITGNKNYLPLFVDTTYYSTILENGEYVNTKEFGISVHVCSGSLAEGDLIDITIEQSSTDKTYQLDDKLFLPTVASKSLYLSGGVTGTDQYIFEVRSSIGDTFDDYTLSKTDPQPYSYPSTNPIISFLINEKEIEFEVDDYFRFYIVGGAYQWRKKESDGDWGTWSVETDLDSEIQLIENGIYFGYNFGAYPAVVEGDKWKLLATQENRASNMLIPRDYNLMHYKGSGDLVFDSGSVNAYDTILIDGHDLDGDVLFEASNVSDFSVIEHSITLTNVTTFLELFAETKYARYFRLSPADSTEWEDITIGFVFIGLKITMSLDADKVVPYPNFVINKRVGKEPFGKFLYINRNFSLSYKSAWEETDFNKFNNLLTYSKINNEMPFYFIPNIEDITPQAYRVTIEEDSLKGLIDMPIDMTAPSSSRIYQWGFNLLGVGQDA